MSDRKGSIGSGFDEFLAEQGSFETHAVAIKRVLVWQLEQAREKAQMSKSEMAEAMNVSRGQLDRVLDSENVGVELGELMNAARVLGREIRVELV